MTTLTQPLRDEHRELLPHVEQILAAADAVQTAAGLEILGSVEEAHEFLAHHLIPHAKAEDAALYPIVQKAMGSPDATATMSRDHIEVGRYVDELAALKDKLTGGPLTIEEARNLRGLLYGVYALVKVHFAKEEEIYLPLLDRWLTPESARALFTRMEAAAHEAKHALHEM